jgi:hypothetical protein
MKENVITETGWSNKGETAETRMLLLESLDIVSKSAVPFAHKASTPDCTRAHLYSGI